jgi:DNA-binding transcriptional ArsR family regulator
VKTLPLARLQAREEHVEAFKALAHLTRLQIFFFLVRQGRDVPAGEIQAELEIPGPTLSHHLDLLRRAGRNASSTTRPAPTRPRSWSAC